MLFLTIVRHESMCVDFPLESNSSGFIWNPSPKCKPLARARFPGSFCRHWKHSYSFPLTDWWTQGCSSLFLFWKLIWQERLHQTSWVWINSLITPDILILGFNTHEILNLLLHLINFFFWISSQVIPNKYHTICILGFKTQPGKPGNSTFSCGGRSPWPKERNTCD